MRCLQYPYFTRDDFSSESLEFPDIRRTLGGIVPAIGPGPNLAAVNLIVFKCNLG